MYDPETELEGKHILLVEDIVDSGRTLNRLIELLVGAAVRGRSRSARCSTSTSPTTPAASHEVRRIRCAATSSWWGMDWITRRTSATCRTSRACSSAMDETECLMPPTPPEEAVQLGRFSKTLSFWILVILIPGRVHSVLERRDGCGARDRLHALRRSSSSATTSRGRRSRPAARSIGEFKQPVSVNNRAGARSSPSQLPVENSDAELERLQREERRDHRRRTRGASFGSAADQRSCRTSCSSASGSSSSGRCRRAARRRSRSASRRRSC